MWSFIMSFLRSRAPYVTLPFAGVVGFIGYNLENILSDKYTPFKKSIVEQRLERQTESNAVSDPTNVEKLQYSANVFGQNVSPSLQAEPKQPKQT